MPRANASNQRFDDSVAIAHRSGDTSSVRLGMPARRALVIYARQAAFFSLSPLGHRYGQKLTPIAAIGLPPALSLPRPDGPAWLSNAIGEEQVAPPAFRSSH